MLSLGSSRPWAEAMELMTGQRKMDASGLVEYFRPLQKWLEAENKKTGEKIGWSATPRYSECWLECGGGVIYACRANSPPFRLRSLQEHQERTQGRRRALRA